MRFSHVCTAIYPKIRQSTRWDGEGCAPARLGQPLYSCTQRELAAAIITHGYVPKPAGPARPTSTCASWVEARRLARRGRLTWTRGKGWGEGHFRTTWSAGACGGGCRFGPRRRHPTRQLSCCPIALSLKQPSACTWPSYLVSGIH